MTRNTLLARIGLVTLLVTTGCTQAGADQQADHMTANATADTADNAMARAASSGEFAVSQPGVAQLASADDCQTFLVGVWTAQGPHDLFGETRELDYRYEFTADGRYETNMRYRNPGADWQDHQMRGSWTTRLEEGRDPRQCELQLDIRQEGMTGSSTSTVTMTDRDSLDLGMGVVLRRQH